MNRTCLSITLAIAVSLMCKPAAVNAFQPEVLTTLAQEQIRDGDAPRAMAERYQAEVVQVNRMNHPLSEATQQLKDAKSSEEKKAATDAIRTELGKQYDQFLEANAMQIEELQARLDKLREQLVRRQDAKEKMVDLELERVINESDGLIWPNSSGRGGMQLFQGMDLKNSAYHDWSPGVNFYPHGPAAIPPLEAPRQPSPTSRPRSAR